jgi:uncharacterized membrane protein YidH (DUF202 family)
LSPAARRPDGGADTRQFDPGLARDRTALAWTRSALSLLAIGTLIARAAFNERQNFLGALTAVVTAALGLVTWRHGRVLYRDRAVAGVEPHHQPGALGFLMIAALAAAAVALIVTIVL